MTSLLSLMTREQELIGNIDNFDNAIAVKEEELRMLKRQKSDEECKLNQIRGFIKNYFKELEGV